MVRLLGGTPYPQNMQNSEQNQYIRYNCLTNHQHNRQTPGFQENSGKSFDSFQELVRPTIKSYSPRFKFPDEKDF